MEEEVLCLNAASYRHLIAAPKPLKPWRRVKGPGIFSIHLSLRKGTVLGLVGPNGAGKTTLLRVMAGILPLQDGSASKGKGTRAYSVHDLRQRVGHMPEQVRWQGQKSVREALLEIAEMRQKGEKRVDGLLHLVGLQGRKNSALNELSQGMRQRLTLAVALLGSPKILLLDEPLNGLDPVGAAAFIALLKSLTERGVSIVLSSHQVEGLVDVVDRLALMHRGHILAEGTAEEVASSLGLEAKVTVKGLGEPPAFGRYNLDKEQIEMKQKDDSWSAQLENVEPELLKKLVDDDFTITEWSIRQPNVVEMLCAATGQSIEDVGLEVASSAYLPLRSFGGEEE